MKRDRRGEPDLPPGPARDLVDLYRRLRHARQLTGGQIAIKTGLSAGHISDILHGWRAPSSDTAMKLASALGATLEEVKRAARLAEELAELNRHNRLRSHPARMRLADPGPGSASSAALRADPVGTAIASRVAVPLNVSEIRQFLITGLPGQVTRYLGTITGDLRRVRCAQVWVNPENTDMQMARFNEFSVSSIIRYEGALRDDLGRVVEDRIADELAEKVAGRRPVLPGTAILTGAGELARYNVRYVVHVAAVQGEPGAGFRQIREIGSAVTKALTEVDRADLQPTVTSILFPLLGAGQGGGDPGATISALAGSCIDYFASAPMSRITDVYFLAYTDVELSVCESVFTASKRLIPVKGK